MVDRTGQTQMVRAPHRVASSGPRHREHRDQRGDGSARREGEGPGGPRPARGRGGPADRGDHLGRRSSVATQGPRGRGKTDGPKSHDPHGPRGGPSLPGSARRSGPSVELRCDVDRGRRGREHRRLDGPSLRDGGGHPRRGRKGVHRPVRLPRGGEARMTVRAHKVRATRGERPPASASLLVLHASELLTLGGTPDPRRREAASELGLIEDGAVYTEGDRIVDVGPTSEVLSRHPRASVPLDATVEAKSGYGLRTVDELKILRAIAGAGRIAGLDVVPTFLGAHAIPSEFDGRPEAYVDLVAGEMLEAVLSDRLASFCDVFVDGGYFSADQARRILTKARDAGLRPKVHADELSDAGGSALAADVHAVSADHLNHASPEGVEAMSREGVIAVLLPATSLASHLPFADGRRLVAAGVPVALGTAFNPTTWCESMQLVIALACHPHGLLPAAATTPATINAAHAIGRERDVGSLESGKLADLLILDMPSWRHLGYRVGGNAVETVVKRGRVCESRRLPE